MMAAGVTNLAAYHHIDDADVPGGDRYSANVIQLDGRCVPPISATARALRCSSCSVCTRLPLAHCLLLLPQPLKFILYNPPFS